MKSKTRKTNSINIKEIHCYNLKLNLVKMKYKNEINLSAVHFLDKSIINY